MLLELEGETQIKGKGYWKFNNELLHDKKFINYLNSEIDKFQKRHFENKCERWEKLKNLMKGIAQEYVTERSLIHKANVKDLEKRLKTQEKRLCMINLRAQNAVKLISNINEKIDKIRLDLNKEYECKAKGAILRAKVNWVERGETNSKYFFSLEKTQAKNKTMKAVKTDNGMVVRDTTKILQEQVNFYKKLYKKDENVSLNYENLPVQITNQEALDQDLTLDEISIALKEMKANKSPGLSGITMDFLKMFWGRIKIIYFEAIQQVIKDKCFFPSARRGLITLILKKNHDIMFVKNWRPISLLEVEYKIFSKALANRLKTSLDEIIHKDQSAFLEGRNIADNLCKTFDVMEFTRINNIVA